MNDFLGTQHPIYKTIWWSVCQAMRRNILNQNSFNRIQQLSRYQQWDLVQLFYHLIGTRCHLFLYEFQSYKDVIFILIYTEAILILIFTSLSLIYYSFLKCRKVCYKSLHL